MLRVSSFKSTGWEVFSAVIACVFLSGRFNACVERRVLNDVTVSILYFITPYCCHLSFVVVISRILLISPKVKNVLSLVSMLVLEARGKTHPLKRFGTIVYMEDIQDS